MTNDLDLDQHAKYSVTTYLRQLQSPVDVIGTRASPSSLHAGLRMQEFNVDS